MTALKVKPWRSGFCGHDCPPDSHARCAGTAGMLVCSCDCHITVKKAAPTMVECPADPDMMCEGNCAPAVEITEPGLVFGMSDDTYHGDPVPGGSLSSTFARLLTEHVPAKAAERRKRNPAKAMNLGKAVHSHALGAGPELIVWEFDGRTKEGKAEREAAKPRLETEAAVAVTERERQQVEDMVAALHAHPEVSEILSTSASEVSGFCRYGEGVWLRARYDLLGDCAWDYKTTQDVTRRGFSKALGSYGYHQQADFYLRVLRGLDHLAGWSPLRFICQETEPPYLVQIHTPDEEAMSVAEELNDRAIRVYAEAKRTGIWPGHPELVAEPTPLPPWYFHDHEDVLPDSNLGLVF